MNEHEIARAVSTRARVLKRHVEILWTSCAMVGGERYVAFAREQVLHGSVQEVKIWARIDGERSAAVAAKKAAQALAEADPKAGWPKV